MTGDTAREPLSPVPDEGRAIALVDHDRGIARAIPTDDQLLARRTLVVPAVTVEPGPFDVTVLDLPESTFGLLLIEGELTSDVSLDGRSLTEILVPGDVETPWAPDLEGLVVTRQLVASEPARLAVLESRFLLACARWPAVMIEIQQRMAAQKQRLAVHGAICQFPRVEDRLLSMLRHIAERSGRVTAEGTSIPGRLTHEALGKLVGARRPTVSLAMKELAAAGRVRRQDDGSWLLLSDEELEDNG